MLNFSGSTIIDHISKGLLFVEDEYFISLLSKDETLENGHDVAVFKEEDDTLVWELFKFIKYFVWTEAGEKPDFT